MKCISVCKWCESVSARLSAAWQMRWMILLSCACWYVCCIFTTVNMNKIFLFLITPRWRIITMTAFLKPFQGVLSWEPSPGLGASTHQLLSSNCYRYWFSLQPRGLHAQDASKAAPPQLPNMSQMTRRYTLFLFKCLSKMFSGGHSQEHRTMCYNVL